jgi:hypothetical protein
MEKNLTAAKMKEALSLLDQLLPQKISIIIAGGGAMVLGHHFPLSTQDIDAFPKGIEIMELDPLIKEVAEKLSIPKDWLNPYFSTFSHVLPSDYQDRLIEIFQGKNLKGLALSKEDLLIMKCFAGRQKDVPHARALVKKNMNTTLVEKHIRELIKKRIPGAEKALEFLHETQDWAENQ